MTPIDVRSFVRAGLIAGLAFAAVYVFEPGNFLLAGAAAFAVGFISYRFQFVLENIPEALEDAEAGLGRAYNRAIHASPLEYVLGGTAVVCCGLTVTGLLIGGKEIFQDIYGPALRGPVERIATQILFSLLACILGSCIPVLAVFGLVALGARKAEKCYWPSNVWLEHEREGHIEKPLTYRNLFRWMFKGLGLVLAFLVYRMWCRLLGGTKRTICRAPAFITSLLGRIYCLERILTGITGVIGGSIGCYFFYTPEATLGWRIARLVVMFAACGAISAVVGMIFCHLAQFLKNLVPAKEEVCA